jgi:hypothetical protein
LWDRPSRLHKVADRYDNPMQESTISGTMNLATGFNPIVL